MVSGSACAAAAAERPVAQAGQWPPTSANLACQPGACLPRRTHRCPRSRLTRGPSGLACAAGARFEHHHLLPCRQRQAGRQHSTSGGTQPVLPPTGWMGLSQQLPLPASAADLQAGAARQQAPTPPTRFRQVVGAGQACREQRSAGAGIRRAQCSVTTPVPAAPSHAQVPPGSRQLGRLLCAQPTPERDPTCNACPDDRHVCFNVLLQGRVLDCQRLLVPGALGRQAGHL